MLCCWSGRTKGVEKRRPLATAPRLLSHARCRRWCRHAGSPAGCLRACPAAQVRVQRPTWAAAESWQPALPPPPPPKSPRSAAATRPAR
eukprot:366445-Chlamydomonas_euryale.AAC.6